MVLSLYQNLLRFSGLPLRGLLAVRQWRGKEDVARSGERMGQAAMPRPVGPLAWIHAASVGEAQSALILIERLVPTHHILITSGTRTSAQYLKNRLPPAAIHQYVPLDKPQWTEKFLDHWRPDIVLWMESELWPCLLSGIKARNIPAALVNARLSDKSSTRWQLVPESAKEVLTSFTLVLAQTEDAAKKYKALGARNVHYTDNLKYSAHPLPVDTESLRDLRQAINTRPVWVYASTHAGEEELAAEWHNALKVKNPGLLTIIVPRHPDRRDEILRALKHKNLNIMCRGEERRLPGPSTDIYIADTLGELGLFYSLCPVAMIGRSFSDDGGGGHNPIEATQLGCAVLSGPHVQYQQDIFNEMVAHNAAQTIPTKEAGPTFLQKLLSDPEHLNAQQEKARLFAGQKAAVIDTVMQYIKPLMTQTQKAQ